MVDIQHKLTLIVICATFSELVFKINAIGKNLFVNNSFVALYDLY